MSEQPEHHVCPVWVGYLLASPLRKLMQNPYKLLSPYVSNGMTVLDVGSAMGFFSIPMAKMVGIHGRVVCVDIQKKMLDVLVRRAHKTGVAGSIIPHTCSDTSLELGVYTETFDFALASAVIHESPTPEIFVREVCAALKPGGILIISEPTGHISEEFFGETVDAVISSGMTICKREKHRWNYNGLFVKL